MKIQIARTQKSPRQALICQQLICQNLVKFWIKSTNNLRDFRVKQLRNIIQASIWKKIECNQESMLEFDVQGGKKTPSLSIHNYP